MSTSKPTVKVNGDEQNYLVTKPQPNSRLYIFSVSLVLKVLVSYPDLLD